MSSTTRVKTHSEIESMREGGRMLAHVLEYCSSLIQPGISTKELAVAARKELKKLGGEPAFLNYSGYPDVMCVSVNDAVVHGIPSDSLVLRTGDVVSLDFGVRWKGLITDSAKTYIVGKADTALRKLVSATEQALEAGINAVHSGCYVGDISSAIESVLRANKLGIVRDLVGHGVGDDLHEEPNIPNYGRPGTGVKLTEGMTVAIEPMATLGGSGVYLDTDHWTVKTRDGSLSAHFEHTLVVTTEGADILTR